ncbi:F-box/LRR-repeat protein 25 [Quercus suber]|uniref:F-box/LRR-repeat protein 25 n=1 Tax=Quercus suber TaxID=58331 RepID=UPI0032DE4166
MDHKNYIAADRISELPNHLQQHILSYLSINEVVQSSVLSKRWKHVWTAVPVLGFNTILFGSTEDKKNLDIQRKLQDFYIFLEKSLESRHKQRLTIREFISHGLDKRSLNSRVDYDKTIQKLVAGRPVIEDMKCHGLKSIKFSGLIKAKLIEVELNDDLERVELEASNLCRVVISQTKQCEINLLSCNNLRMLTLSAPNITDKWLHNHFSQLPLIDYLSVYSHTLERLKISSHSLKTLYLMHWGSLIEVDIDTPNLCKFAYCGRNVIPFSSNALAPSEVTYQMLKPPLDIAPWNVEKIEFLTKLGNPNY